MIRTQYSLINDKLENIVQSAMPNKVYGYSDKFLDIIKKAGFHQINICWLDKNLIGVVKDSFTSNIPENKLKEMAIQNGLVECEYKFIDQSMLAGPKVRHIVFVRYNSTQNENKFWQEMQNKLIADKNNFNIKRRFIIIPAFTPSN